MPEVEPLRYLSTVQAASMLAVSVSTVKRWVDEGVLPADRTAGGHRKLRRAEVLALARRGELPRGELASLPTVGTRRPSVDLDRTVLELTSALQAGQTEEVSGIIRRAYDSGVAVEIMADRLIAPAMARLGHEWESGSIDVWQEHRGTQSCVAALAGLGEVLAGRAEKNRPIAIGAAPEGDPYLLPTLLAQYTLLDSGWEAVNLGPNTPLRSLALAIEELRPRMVWLSVSHLDDAHEFIADYHDLYRVAERRGAAVAVGGQALKESLRSAIPYTTHGDGLTHLAAFARTLHPRPKTPRRGRPSS